MYILAGAEMLGALILATST